MKVNHSLRELDSKTEFVDKLAKTLNKNNGYEIPLKRELVNH